MPSNLEHALALALEGWAVFPIWHCVEGVCACGNPDRGQIGKHPRCANGHLNATSDPEQIKTWWCAPDAAAPHIGFEWECCESSNIGIAVPDGIIIVDVDPRNGGDATFDIINEQKGFPTTAEVLSGSGGLHMYYLAPKGMQYPKTLNDHGGPGIDIKQLGGYVLAPPSVHKSGGRYAYANENTKLLLIADAPDWLLALGTSRKERIKRTIDRNKASEPLSAAALKDGDAIISILEPHYVEGSKHAIARSFGAYCKSSNRTAALAEYVVSQLPSTDPEMRVESALTYYSFDGTTGWRELSEHLPDDAQRALELAIKGPSLRRTKKKSKTIGLKLSTRKAMKELEPDENPLNAWTDDEDPALEVEPIDYVCEHFGIAEGKVSLLGGFAGSGKSPLGLLFAVCVASGKPFLEQKVSQRPVVFFMYEGERLSKIRRNRICLAMGVDRAEIPLRLRRARGGFTVESLASIRDASLWYRDQYDGQHPLFVHDTYTSAMRGIDQNAAEYAEALWTLGDIGDETGCVNLVLGHLKKTKDEEIPTLQSMSGHNAIASAAQTAIGLVQNKTKSEEVTLHPLRVPEIPFKPVTVSWRDVRDPNISESASILQRTLATKWGLACDIVESGPSKAPDAKEAIAREIIKLLTGKPYGLNSTEICASISGSDAMIVAAAKSLAAAGILRTEAKGRSLNYVKT